MKTLLEIFADAKEMENMGQNKTLICIDNKNVAVYNARILDPYLKTLLVKVDEKEMAVSFTDVQAMNVQADFVD